MNGQYDAAITVSQSNHEESCLVSPLYVVIKRTIADTFMLTPSPLSLLKIYAPLCCPMVWYIPDPPGRLAISSSCVEEGPGPALRTGMLA